MVQLHGEGLRTITITATTTTTTAGTMITTIFMAETQHYSDAVAEGKCDESGKCQFFHIPRVGLYGYTNIQFIFYINIKYKK